MAFLDEVDSLKARVGLSASKPVVLIGLVVAVVVVVVLGAFTLWGSFTNPGVVIDQEGASLTEEASDAAESSYVEKVCVHVVGSVQKPGMYELSGGARVSDAVEAAGGFTDDANQQSVNLARELTDGEQIVVGSTQEAAAAQAGSSEQTGSSAAASGDGRVNINTASAEELTTLDGVGDATASKIIAYREANGSFSSIEEIKEVSGIGDKKFEAMKDHITV